MTVTVRNKNRIQIIYQFGIAPKWTVKTDVVVKYTTIKAPFLIGLKFYMRL